MNLRALSSVQNLCVNVGFRSLHELWEDSHSEGISVVL